MRKLLLIPIMAAAMMLHSGLNREEVRRDYKDLIDRDVNEGLLVKLNRGDLLRDYKDLINRDIDDGLIVKVKATEGNRGNLNRGDRGSYDRINNLDGRILGDVFGDRNINL